jgi:hypothetical protein
LRFGKAPVPGINTVRGTNRAGDDAPTAGFFPDVVRPGYQNIRTHFKVKANASASDQCELVTLISSSCP